MRSHELSLDKAARMQGASPIHSERFDVSAALAVLGQGIARTIYRF